MGGCPNIADKFNQLAARMAELEERQDCIEEKYPAEPSVPARAGSKER